MASIPSTVPSNPIIFEIVLNVPPEPQIMSLCSSINNSRIWSASPSIISSSPVASTRILAPCIHLGDAGVLTSAYNLTTHSPLRYLFSSKSRTSVLDNNSSLFIHDESTSAPALGDEAKHTECIFTPHGILITGIIDFLRESNVDTISLVVPSPPAYSIKSTFESISRDTNSKVSD